MTTYLERYAEIAKRLISTSGGEALHGLSPELMLAVVLENDRPEFAALGGTKLWVATSGVLAAGGAGFFGECLIATGSPNILFVITHVISLGQTAIVGLGADVGMTGPVADANRFRDNRLAGRPGAQVFTKVTNAPGALTSYWPCIANVMTPVELVCASQGSGIANSCLIRSLTNNTALEVYLLGYERNADPHEIDRTVS